LIVKALVFQLLLVTAAVGAPSETLGPPTVKAGDTWTYRVTTDMSTTGWHQSRDETVVSRVTSTSIYYTVKPTGSTQPPKELFAGLDWSRSRDIGGEQTVVNRPLSFPLSAGKTWQVQYTEQHPTKLHRSEKWNTKCTVLGHESVDVPAGTFDTVKVECEGTWTAEMEPTVTVAQSAQANATGVDMATHSDKITAGEHSGRTYKAFWYVPAVKRWVKSVEEYYSSSGVRTESHTGELESFKVDP